MRPETLARLARWGGWLLLIALAVVTLGPIGVRPISHAPVSIEHILAFLVLGTALAMGYPRRPWLVLGFIIAAAVALEVGQAIDPTRHARIMDAVQKLIGGGLGVGLGLIASRLVTRPR